MSTDINNSTLASAVDPADLSHQAVQVNLSEGSVFMVPAQDLLAMAARNMILPGLDAAILLKEELLPALKEYPQLLLEIASTVSWAELKKLAVNAVWRTPPIFVTEAYRSKALMTLHSGAKEAL